MKHDSPPAPVRARTARRSRVDWQRLAAVLVPAALAASAPAALSAQMPSQPSRIVTGDSLRLKLPGALWIDAHFESWNADVMMLGVQGVVGSWPVSIMDLEGLQLYSDRSPREGFRHWAMLGAVGGLFAGAAVGLLLDTTGAGGDVRGPSAKTVGTVMRWSGLGAVAGAIAGGVYGGARPGIGWIQIALPVN